MASTYPYDDPDIDDEVATIARTVDDGGPLSEPELARRVAGRLWGPGRFRRALRAALQRGAVRRDGRTIAAATRP